jgi:hypothetical protein
MLALMGVLVIFARMASLAGPRLLLPAQVLTWFTLLLFMIVSASLLSSVFLQKPLNLSCWLTHDCSGPPPPVVHVPYASEFVATMPINRSFDEVHTFFEKELLRTRATGTTEVTAPDVTKLVEHYIAERTKYYTVFPEKRCLRDSACERHPDKSRHVGRATGRSRSQRNSSQLSHRSNLRSRVAGHSCNTRSRSNRACSSENSAILPG